MPRLPAPLRVLACTAASSVALLLQAGAMAQELPSRAITGADIRQALIWTGHLGAMVDGDPAAVFRDAVKSWQASKHYPLTETLPDEQAGELIGEGLQRRDSVGWAMLQDKSVGFSIGVPTRLTKFVATQPSNSTLFYEFEGSVGYSVAIQYGNLNCSNMNALYARVLRTSRPSYRARRDDWFVIANEADGRSSYTRAVCRTSGILIASVAVATDQMASQGILFATMADSLVVSRTFNPTAVAHPRIDAPPALPVDTQAERTAHRQPAAKLPLNVDGAGKTAAVKVEPKEGADLSTQEVFEKTSGAVYMVKAGTRQGSAVAVSENELLTNCHVVGDQTRVAIVRGKQEIAAKVTSMNAEADRCVLRTDTKLAKWVSLRPYEDIKVGERALTIGTPLGLELTVAEGIVSSKRTDNKRRLIQTSAPISQGSSGGGLFDAQGHLLGITTFYAKFGQNLNFAVAAEEFAR